MLYNKVVGVFAGLLVVILATVCFFGRPEGSLMSSNTIVGSVGLVKAATREEAVQYVSGDKIFDGNGSEVIWRGAGGSYIFHARDRYQEAWQLHLPEIQAMGLNTVRLAFAFPDSGINPEYGTPSADILDFNKLDLVLDFLTAHQIKAILDLHNWADMIGDFGSQKLVDDWVRVAVRYRGDSRIVAYELFNEPGSETWAPSIA
jgi:aryl-phospho-beta-D-glucosidase BglC (GH1 family)